MNYPRTLAVALATTALLSCPLAIAGPAETESATRCLADNTTGRDRKDLARWIFLAMAAHPEIREMSKASAAQNEQSQREVAGLFTRLVGEVCAAPMRALVKAEGPAALGKPFEVLGQLAMQELMSNDAVKGSIGGFERFIDRAKVEPVLKP
jgi:hypothetical protein